MVIAARLRRTADIVRVRSEGSLVGDRLLSLRAASGIGRSLRLAASSQRGIGSAVVRNRARRRLREAIRADLRGRTGVPALDVVAVARPALLRASAATLRASVHRELDELLRPGR